MSMSLFQLVKMVHVSREKHKNYACQSKNTSRTTLFANILIKVLRQQLVVKYVTIMVSRSTYRNMRKPKQVHRSTTESNGPVTCSQDVKGQTEGFGLNEVLDHKNKCSDNMNIIFNHGELCIKSLLEITFRDPLKNKHPISRSTKSCLHM